MKKTITAICLIIVLTGCEKFFKDDLDNRLEITDSKSMENAIAGMHNRFNNTILSNFDAYFFNSDEVAYINEYASSGTFCAQRNTGIKYSSENFWQDLYITIASANSIIEKSQSIQKTKEIQALLGEAYFIRAFTYFRLVRHFGQVPIINDIEINFSVKKSDFNEVYAFIIGDLNTAIKMLPANNQEARVPYVSPHRGTVKALLAEVYLSMAGYPLKQAENYKLAALMAKEVIDSSEFFGYGLMNDFNDLWNGRYKLNKETVFSFYTNDQNIKNYQNAWDYPNSNSLFGNSKVGIKFYNDFPVSYRKEMTYRVESSLHLKDSFPLPNTINLCSEILFKKIYYPFNSEVLSLNEGRTIYLIRYAHTLLTYAEAKARAGNLDQSVYEAFNMVRRRAYKQNIFSKSVYDLSPGLSPEQFADSAVVEKAWEFCGEPENRTLDFLRLQMYNQLPLMRFKDQGLSSAVGIDEKTLFFSIPKIDQKLNPNLE